MSNERFVLHPDQEHARAAAQQLYQIVETQLATRLPANAEIHHIGATAIPGCLTKGDLDVVVRVRADDFRRADAVLAEMFMRNEGSIRTETFAAFEDKTRSPHLGVQLTVIDGPFNVFHQFVEALRNSPALIEAYNAIKLSYDGRDMDAYRKAKDAFVERTLAAHRSEPSAPRGAPAIVNDVTHILNAIEQGEPHAASQLLPLVYDELRKLAARKIAQEKPGQTLQATALVHETYLRLVGQVPDQHWDHRGHFFAAAAEAMRRILVEKARRKQSRKQGGGLLRHESAPVDLPGPQTLDPLEVLAIHEVLDQFAAKSPRKAELVRLRYFLGCTMAEAAQVLGIALKTAEEDWTYSKAWLRRHWRRGEEP